MNWLKNSLKSSTEILGICLVNILYPNYICVAQCVPSCDDSAVQSNVTDSALLLLIGSHLIKIQLYTFAVVSTYAYKCY